MGVFREYLAALAAAEASGAQRPRMDDAKLDELLRRCEWFTAAGIVRAAQLGVRDARLDAVAASRGAGLLSLPRVDGSVITAETPDDLIDRFLREEDLRIVVRNDQPESASEQVRTEAELSDEEDLVSEELAEIYLAQGLRSEALAAYRKLSLLNPEKSVYFAKIIGQIETNN